MVEKITVCGHYQKGIVGADGQTVKTQNVYIGLVKKYGQNAVGVCDTFKWKSAPFRMLLSCINAVKASDNIVILPAHNGLRVFVPLFYFLSKFKSVKLHYVVIGGWISEYLSTHKVVGKILHNYEGIYVETTTMKKQLEELGYKNVYILPNFKEMNFSKKNNESKHFIAEPYSICTFSRVMVEKGIEDAINAVTEINEKNGKIIYKLDIYGQIDDDYREIFLALIESFPKYIKYRGIANSKENSALLKNYYLLLFPTKYSTEGIPGTIIDAYAAGTPVLSSRWNSFSDIIVENKTGIGFEINNYEDFRDKLFSLSDSSQVNPMRANCIKESKKYTDSSAMKILYSTIEGTRK